jgi:hypothetical protein
VNNIPKRIKRLWGVTLFRGQQSKAARGQGRGRGQGGEVPIVHHEETVPAGEQVDG